MTNDNLGAFGEFTNSREVRLVRILPAPIERVWAFLTDAEKRGTWLARGPMDLRLGGRVHLAFDNAALSNHEEPPEKYKECPSHQIEGVVTKCEPPDLLSFTWPGGSDVSFELVPLGEETRMVLTHRRLNHTEESVSIAAGWHVHVAYLIARLSGQEPPRFWANHGRLEQEYAARLAAGPVEEKPIPTVRLKRHFDTTAERLFDAWLDPDLIRSWMYHPELGDQEPPRVTVDARRGGAFSFQVRRHGQAIEIAGQYLEIDRPRRLAFTWAVDQTASSRVELAFTPEGAACELTLTHELHPDWADFVTRTESGWKRLTDSIAKLL